MSNVIKTAYVSEGLKFFRERFTKKFNLNIFDIKNINSTEPLVIFSPCREEDYNLYKKYKGHVTVVWCGSDAMMIDDKRELLLKSREARHIATSSFIADDLDKLNIPYIFLPISAANIDLESCDRGDNIYFYGDNNPKRDFYGHSYLDEVEKRTGLNIIRTNKNSYSHNDLIEVYKTCFVGLRLTIHDGVPTTVTELGLMGRRCVHNGNTPHSYPYKNVDDICESVMKEYDNRHINDVEDVSKDWKEYINIGNDWLYI